MFSKQVLLKAKTVEFDEDNIGVLNITPNFENAPTTNIICHYYNADGLIVSGQLAVSFRDELNNYVRRMTKANKPKATNSRIFLA